MRNRTITGSMLIVAVIHLLPLSGFFGGEHLASLYGITLQDPNLEILMRHRAILFAILGSFLAYAAFRPSLQPIAFVAAFMSISTFFYLAYAVGGFNAAIRKVVIVDAIAAIALAIAIIVYYSQQRDPATRDV